MAALSETRLSGDSEFIEIGAGYTFFCHGYPEGQPRQAGVGFAIKNSLVSQIITHPKGISPWLMTMDIQLHHGQTISMISAYAPTLSAPNDEKEAFYEDLDATLGKIPFKQRLFLLGDFNA